MSLFNITGIKPAYRRLVMDLSITLGQVLDFANVKPDAYQVVNVRGQVNSAYAPAQVQDFMEWLMGVSPSWSIQTMPPEGSPDEVIVESFDISQFQSAYAKSSFVKYLARLLHQGSITILMRTVPGDDPSYRLLSIEIMERNHATVLVFTSGTAMHDINTYQAADGSLVELSNDAQQVVVNPYQVASVIRSNSRTMGDPRSFKNVSVQCGALIGRNGTVESALPLTQAMILIENTVLNNLVEYGFKLTAQLRLLAAINAEVLDAVIKASRTRLLGVGQNFYISVDFVFLDDDRAGVDTAPWNQVIVTITPVKTVTEEATIIDDAA